MDKKKLKDNALRGLILMFRKAEWAPPKKSKKEKKQKPTLDSIIESVAKKEKE